MFLIYIVIICFIKHEMEEFELNRINIYVLYDVEFELNRINVYVLYNVVSTVCVRPSIFSK